MAAHDAASIDIQRNPMIFNMTRIPIAKCCGTAYISAGTARTCSGLPCGGGVRQRRHPDVFRTSTQLQREPPHTFQYLVPLLQTPRTNGLSGCDSSDHSHCGGLVRSGPPYVGATPGWSRRASERHRHGCRAMWLTQWERFVINEVADSRRPSLNPLFLPATLRATDARSLDIDKGRRSWDYTELLDGQSLHAGGKPGFIAVCCVKSWSPAACWLATRVLRWSSVLRRSLGVGNWGLGSRGPQRQICLSRWSRPC